MFQFWKKKGSGSSFPVYDESGKKPVCYIDVKYFSEDDVTQQILREAGLPFLFAEISLLGKGELLKIDGIRSVAEDGSMTELVGITRQGVAYASIEERYNNFFYRQFIVYDALLDTTGSAIDSTNHFMVVGGMLRRSRLVFWRGDRMIARVSRTWKYGKFVWGLGVKDDQDEMLILAVTLAIEAMWNGV